MLNNHEWITGYREFEAVLQCVNPLPDWNADSAVRGFQTFGWNDASTPGNGMTFAHDETGVFIQYEGELVAIQFTEGRLADALPDLFMVLFGFGWREAVVYHAPETIGALLADIGRSIAAGMDFDVRAAQSLRSDSEYGFHSSLVGLGRGTADDDTLLGELGSMGRELGVHQHPDLTAVTAPLVLPDEEPVLGDEFHKFTQTNTAVQAQSSEVGYEFLSRVQTTNNLTSAPIVASRVVAPAPAWGSPMRSAAAATRLFEAPGDDASGAVSGELRQSTPIETESAAGNPGVHTSTKNIASEVATVSRSSASSLQSDTMKSVISVGLSTFCFITPSAGVAKGEIDKLIAQASPSAVVHMYPGALNEKWRWNVLGEIEEAYPWFAEKFVHAMGISERQSAFVSSFLLDVKRSLEVAQLRDLITACLTLDEHSNPAGVALSPSTNMLMRRCGHSLAEEALDALAARFEALFLCPVGAGFVDVTNGAVGVPEQVFTVRQILQSSESHVYVIHVDAMDGPFVGTLVELLRWVVSSHAASGRYTEIRHNSLLLRNQEKEREKEQVVSAITSTVNGLLKSLRDVGIDV